MLNQTTALRLERATYCGPLADPRCRRWLDRFPVNSRLWVLQYPGLGDDEVERSPLAAARWQAWRVESWLTLPLTDRIDWMEIQRQTWGL